MKALVRLSSETEDGVRTSGQPQFRAVLCLCIALVLQSTEPQSILSPVKYRPWKCWTRQVSSIPGLYVGHFPHPAASVEIANTGKV
jgi:hypothetical protein